MINCIIVHFKLPPKVLNSIQEFVLDDEFTFLSSIKQNQREKVFKLIEELVLVAISTGSYDARMHYLIIDVAELLGIPRELVEIHCESIYELLLGVQRNEIDRVNEKEESEKYREKRETKRKIKKYLMIGLASIGGGAVIGVTGGLAAPVVLSAFGAVLGAGSVVMSSAAAGLVGSLFGVAGAGLTASKMNKRVGDLEEFSFKSLRPEFDQTSLTVTIAISGWISEQSEQQFTKPWRNLRHSQEQYCLCYESKYLLELNQAMDYLLSFVVSYAAQEALKHTFLAGVMYAIAWPTALISMANIIDNPWDVCVGRSAEAGKHLADVLISRQQGKRPVSLIGFSLGARVIYFCLQELNQRKNSEGIICDVVLLGAPVSASLDQWKPLGRIISGRIINGYSSSDWLLKFLYRTSSAAIRVAGLQELCWQDRRVKNVDLTHLVGGHSDYYKKLSEILDFVGLRTIACKTSDDDELATAAPTLTSGQVIVESPSSAVSITNSPSTDSGIERTVSSNISTSLSQQSLAQTPTEHPFESCAAKQQTSKQVAVEKPVAACNAAAGRLQSAKSLLALGDDRSARCRRRWLSSLAQKKASAASADLRPTTRLFATWRLRTRSRSI